MKTIQVEITGETPLLMNSPKGMLEEAPSIVQKTAKRDYKALAEAVAYRTKKGILYCPSTAIKGCLINASSFKKIGKYSAKPIIAGGLRIVPEEIEVLDAKGKPQKDYEIDLRTVVLMRKDRIIKARPKILEWKLAFEIKFNDQMIADAEIIKVILTEAGERIGILDFAPRHNGDFGCFKITKWKVTD